MLAGKFRNLTLFMATLFALVLGGQVWAATNAELAAQVRGQWQSAQKAYLEAIKPHSGTALATQYTDTLNKTGALLDQYIALKLAAAPATQVKPVADQLIKNLGQLRILQSKASGPMVTVLGTALSQHNLATQNALKNMR